MLEIESRHLTWGGPFTYKHVYEKFKKAEKYISVLDYYLP